MAAAEDHLRELLKLPMEDRARAAKQLIDSLDGEDHDPDAEALRALELTRRAETVANGSAELVDSAEVRRRIAARLRYVRNQ